MHNLWVCRGVENHYPTKQILWRWITYHYFLPIRINEDYSALQHDIDMITDWANINSMQFNSAKCKFMLVSKRRNNTTPSPPMCLNGSPLESVPTFKYLGVLLSSDLTWSKHVQSICSRARQLIGLLYRRYYQYSDCNTLLQLYSQEKISKTL